MKIQKPERSWRSPTGDRVKKCSQRRSITVAALCRCKRSVNFSHLLTLTVWDNFTMVRWIPVLSLICLTAAAAEEPEVWTRFRGPNGTGVSKDTGFPVTFDKNTNTLWR